MLSILLLTHNRRESFFKSIDSISLIDSNIDIEVLVNCDDGSITDEDIDGLNYSFDIQLFTYLDFNSIYANLYREARGEYIMYLEDDDILLSGINTAIDYIDRYDLIVSLYEPYREGILTYSFKELREKVVPYIPEYFQLSQMIFKKIDLEFPDTYSHQNDEALLESIINNSSSFKYSPAIIFRQGVDGQNVSLEDIE